MRVLQIEDDEPTAQVVAQALNSKGFSCDTAYLGEEAIGLATENKYDLILLDIMLPDIDGYEVLRRLRDADVHTPVIIQTALPGREGGSDRLGVMDCLIKPFNGSDLHDCVSAVLERAGSSDSEQVVEDRRRGSIPRRRHKRFKTLKSGQIIRDNSSQVSNCIVVNMSVGGCALKLSGDVDIPEIFVLKLESGETHRCHVCWRYADKVGVMFVQPQS
jgi:DNA-binding response OmpR family regulator